MNFAWPIIMCFILGTLACQDAIHSTKSFSGPIFSEQLTADTLTWTYDPTHKSFDFFQARMMPSFLFVADVEAASLSTLLSIPMHGAGLKLEGSDRTAMVLVDMLQIRWMYDDQSDTMVVTPEDYPIGLRIDRDQQAIKCTVTLKDQMPKVVLEAPKVEDLVRVGLYVEGFGGFNFDNVRYESRGASRASGSTELSKLEMLDIATRKRETLHQTPSKLRSLSWSPEGTHIYFVETGILKQLAVEEGTIAAMSSLGVDAVWGASLHPDATQLAVSAVKNHFTQLFFLPVTGGESKLKIARAPSYFSTWTSAGHHLLYTAARRGNQLDIYRTTRKWGREERMTHHDSTDAGAMVTPDDRHIYFHSNRTGKMKIWRMDANGQNKIQVTTDDWQDWYPQPSPDGRWLLIRSDLTAKEHPQDRDRALHLRLLDLHRPRQAPKIVATFRGDPTTPVLRAWSPEGDRIVFIAR